MLYRHMWNIVLLFMLCICSTQGKEIIAETDLAESYHFAEFLESVYQKILAQNPELSTKLGKKDNNSNWNDRSITKMDEDVRQNWRDLQSLHTTFEYSKLSDLDQLNYRAFEADLKLRIKRYSWRYHLSPINQIVGVHLEIPGLLTKSHMIENLQDAQAYLLMQTRYLNN